MNKVFVYGTLLEADTGRCRWHGPHNVASSRHATVKARLFDLGSFPCIVLDENGTVRGKVFEIDDATLENFDWIEGAGSQGFYSRKRTTARYDDGSKEEVWIYCFEKPSGDPIESGQWNDWYDSGNFLIPVDKGDEPRRGGK